MGMEKESRKKETMKHMKIPSFVSMISFTLIVSSGSYCSEEGEHGDLTALAGSPSVQSTYALVKLDFCRRLLRR